MKKSNNAIGNRTRDLLACSAVPQPTAPPRAPLSNCTYWQIYTIITVSLLLYTKHVAQLTRQAAFSYQRGL